MFPDFNIYSSPLLILSLQGFIFSLLLLYRYLINKNNSDLFLCLILLITCYHQTAYTMGFMGWYDTFQNTKINYYLVDLALALAPLIYFYVRSITNPKRAFCRRDLFHFIPILILLFLKVFILVYDSSQLGFEETQNGYLVLNIEWKYIDPIVALISILQMLIYLVLSFQLLVAYREKIVEYFSNTFKLQLNWLYIFLIIYSFLYLYYSVQIVVNAIIIDLSWRQEWWYYLLSGLAIIYVGIRGYYTDLSALKGIEIESFLEGGKGYQPNSNPAVLVDTLPQKIKDLMEQIDSFFKSEKPYLEPELTLVSLAKKLNTSREELSEAINKGFNTRFNDFVNKYRVQEFKLKITLGKHKQLSLLGLAYECGFNSKSTFNRAFKKVVKTSPSEYLKTVG